MLVITLIGIGLWWGQRAIYFRHMAEKHQREVRIYQAVKEAHPSSSPQCSAIIDYHSGLERIYRNAVFTPWVIVYEHPYETSVVGEVQVLVEPTPESQVKLVSKADSRVGLDGYCPVTLVRNSKWIKGNAEFTSTFQGISYLFASAVEQQAFLENPQQYAPACGGNDIVRLVDDRFATPGDRNHGVIYEHRIYLFESEVTLARFQASPKNYSPRANVAVR